MIPPSLIYTKDIRKEQHQREQKWKADGRDQIKQNTNFDMARSLFGGGSGIGGGGPETSSAMENEQDHDDTAYGDRMNDEAASADNDDHYEREDDEEEGYHDDEAGRAYGTEDEDGDYVEDDLDIRSSMIDDTYTPPLFQQFYDRGTFLRGAWSQPSHGQSNFHLQVP